MTLIKIVSKLAYKERRCMDITYGLNDGILSTFVVEGSSSYAKSNCS